ncbi:hypothetical protein OEZ86_010441 [Tetradesmus obliquus]|nr:hypothetical protein OEZ86_010441 [Tetradesmus obliquus]
MSLCDGHKERRASGVRVSVLAEADDDLPICWICLGHSEPDRPLTHPCRCPSWCHATCVARWQLQSAGTRREKFCDFCSCELPDWKSVLTPTPAPTAPAVMNVNFDNKTYSFQVLPGADGYRQFTEAIRKAFHLPDDSELNITFTCDEPSSAGSLLTLSGPGAYDAAVHCASSSRVSEAGSDEHVSSSSAAAAAAGELGRGSSSSSSISRTSVSGASSSGSSSSGEASNGSSSSSRRSQGFGRKLRDAIADMLISK